jgi:TatD DNase family protein
MICVGTTLADSAHAIEFVSRHERIWASIGIHPHEAKVYANDEESLQLFADLAAKPGVIAVGECGLDYFYGHSPKEDQERILRFQIELALKHDLPLIFHTREAFDDFWPIFDSYQGIRGVLHSFTDTQANLSKALERGLYIGVNGIATFTKDEKQLAMYKAIPSDRLLLETDAPFLTPAPFRGKICEPKHTVVTAEFLSTLRGELIGILSQATTQNACRLFNVNL